MPKICLIFIFGLIPGFSLFAQTMSHCNCGTEANGKKLYGFCDSLRTKVIIPCQYDSSFAFSNGMARVIKDGKTGYVDGTGKLVIPAIYDRGENFSEGLAFVNKEGKCFYINKAGINPFKKTFYCPTAPVVPGASESVIKMLKANEAEAYKQFKFQEGMVLVADTAKKLFGYMDTKGVLVIAPKYQEALPFSGGLAFVKESTASPYMAIDKKGAKKLELAPGTKPMPEGFKDGMARTMGTPDYNKKDFNIYNYTDTKGKMLLASSVADATPFSGNFAVIKKGTSEMAMIDKSGKPAFAETYNYLEASPIKGIYFFNRISGKGYGLIDTAGKIRVEVGFEHFTRISDSILLCNPNKTAVYTLVSIHAGDLFGYTRFTKYNWVTTGKKPVLRLSGTDILNYEISLDYEPSTGRFLKDGQPLPDKDNIYLAKKTGGSAKPGIFTFENEHFKLKFPEPMELFRDEVDKKVYSYSTFFFGIKKLDFSGSSGDYMTAMTRQLEGSGKYDKVERVIVSRAEGPDIEYLRAVEKKKSGETQGVLVFLPLARSIADPGKGKLYVFNSNYFLMDETKYSKHLSFIINSIRPK